MENSRADKSAWIRSSMYGGIAILAAMVVLALVQQVSGRDLFPAKEHVVTLTAEGFVPQELTIKKDDVVVFRSALHEPFWPASNLHPSHSIYAAFDPQEPIGADDSWRFQFTQVGTWKYHDHVSPEQTGVIIVEGDSESTVEMAAEDCGVLSGSEKIQCFDTVLEGLLKEKGIEAAFEYFVGIYNADPEVPAVCHGWAHRLGEVEYELYKEGKEVSLRPEATFCSYGYFHGFINTMVEDTQNVQTAVKFCEDAVKEKGEELRGMLSNCVHGIGHSISTLMLEDPDNWGNFQKVTDTGAAECEKLYTQVEFLNICFDGLFHELHLSVMREDYGMSYEEYLASGDQFYYCRHLSEKFMESCFYDFITLWPHFFTDKKEAMQFVLDTVPDLRNNGWRPMRTFARSFIESEITTGQYQDSVDACNLAPDFLYPFCMQGLAAGFVTHGEPNKMHEAGFAFCREYFEGDDHLLCIEKVIDELSWTYSVAQLQEACTLLTPEEASPCALYKNTPGS